MASQVWTNYLEDAQEAKAIAIIAKALFTRFKAYLLRNSTMSWDHTAGSLPAYIKEDESSNIKGLDFSRDELANFIGSIDNVKTLLEGGTPSTGNHWGNIEKLADG